MATLEKPRTEVRAEARYVRAAPRKAQLVVEQIRGRPVPEARTILAFMTRDAARDVEKVLSSAVANAETNHGLVGDELVVRTATVGAGPTLKRWRARARGRVARIKKRTCHIVISLGLPEQEAIPEPRGSVVVEPPAPAEAPAAETPAEPVEEEKPKPKRAPRKKPTASGAEEKPKAKPRKAPAKKSSTGAAKPARRKPKSEES